MGDQCWFVARAVETKPPHTARLLWIEPIAAERVRSRVPELFRQLKLRALCVDAGPLRDLSRDLVFALNGLEAASCVLRTPGQQVVRATHTEGTVAGSAAVTWHEASEKWRHARCAAVEFTQREGQGLRHKVGRTQEGRLYPLLAAHRDETIERVIAELLPPNDAQPRLIEQPDGTAKQILTPRFLLPMPTEETRAVLDVYERHLLAGARQERSSDGKSLRYLDKCENHFLLATAYAALAELLAPSTETQIAVPAFRAVPVMRAHGRRERSVAG